MLKKSAPAADIGDLDLVIRHVLAGLGHGLHAGRERGAGVEFSEYRAYAPGDEWRRVDWKLMARADRYFVREAERDSHVACWLVLDATASMAEPSRSVPHLDKLSYARTLLGCVAAIAERQGDAFGMIVLSAGGVQFTPASRGPRQMQRILAGLARASADGELPGAEALRAALHFAQSPAMVFAAGDFLDWPSPLSEALVRLRHMRHDVRVACLQTQAEQHGAFDPATSWRDPEHAGMVYRFDAAAAAAYRERRAAHFDLVAAEWKKHDIPALMATIEDPVRDVLRAWLRKARPA